MKKILVISLSGVLVGGLFAFLMFSNIKEEVNAVVSSDTKVTAFQIGVYSIYDNAIKVQKEYPESYIYKDEDKYRIFIAIYQDSEIINLIKKYYENKNINFYLKEINTNDSFIEELNKYEKILKKSNDIEIYIKANKNILKIFGDTI